jgi:predicted alpha/beta superfamily hydrolase
MSLKILLPFMLFAFTSRYAEVEEREITFVVVVPDSLVTNDTLYIAGSVKQLGDWQPNGVPLIQVDKNTWRLTIKLPLNENIEYKFTRGSWHKEEVLSDGTIPGNKHLTITKNQTVTHQIENWVDRFYKPIGGITGTLKYHYNFYSNSLKNERTIVVWLPESYETERQKRYPVLYMHDGQNLFDPHTSYIGVDWQMDETADSLIKKGEIQEIIIVGIYNTPDRIEEYSDTEKGRAYMDFIIHDVKPFIDNNYRTLPDRDHTAVMGSSMGGLISFFLIWRYPQIFSKAGCLSTSLYWNNGALLKEIENFTGQKPEIKIYLDSSGKGSEGRMKPDYENLKTLLISKGFEDGKDVEYYFDKEGDHSERSWSKRVWQPLKFLFGTQEAK